MLRSGLDRAIDTRIASCWSRSSRNTVTVSCSVSSVMALTTMRPLGLRRAAAILRISRSFPPLPPTNTASGSGNSSSRSGAGADVPHHAIRLERETSETEHADLTLGDEADLRLALVEHIFWEAGCPGDGRRTRGHLRGEQDQRVQWMRVAARQFLQRQPDHRLRRAAQVLAENRAVLAEAGVE